MAVTASLYQHSLQNNLQNNLHDHSALADHNQYPSAVFCRALYDYQSKDASSLSFRKGDIIEVLTQLDSGWWDGLLHDERGWFPSNYVAPVSEQEIEQELRAARVDPQDSDWLQERPESSGPPSDFWVPQVAADGRIFYVNTQTGERSSDLPTEADSDTEPLVTNTYSNSTITLAASTSPSLDSSTTAVTVTDSPTAGFGLPKRSGTPEPWVKRLADDGMSYYYLNTIDASIRWTAPSPQLDPPRQSTNDTFSFSGGRQRTSSSAARDRLSIYSDDSDINPLGILGRAAAHVNSISYPTATTPTPGQQQQDDASHVRAAKELQAVLRGQFPPVPQSLDDLAQSVRAAITDLLDTALVRSNTPQVRDAMKRMTDAVRDLVYASSTLIGPLTSLPPPYNTDAASSDVAELKQFHRKVTATMVKLVSAVRASESSVGNIDTPTRYDADAAELERAIAAFVDEVLRRRTPDTSTRHVRAVFRSADGHKGIGLELLGAGAAGAWKGFGFVEPIRGGRLGPEIMMTVNQHKLKLDDTLTKLEALVAEGQAIVSNGHEGLQHLVSFLGFVGSINVARALDFDSDTMDAPYVQSVARAKELVRALEAAVQAAFEDGAVLLNVVQSASVVTAEAQDRVRPWGLLVSAIPALRSNIDSVYSNIMALFELAQSQADACAKAGLDASIGFRDVSRYSLDSGRGSLGYQMDDDTEYDPGPPRDSSEDDMVGFEDAFGSRPSRADRDRDRDFDPNFSTAGQNRSDSFTEGPYDGNGMTRGHSNSFGGSMDSMSRGSPATMGDMTLPANVMTPASRNAPLAEDDDLDEEDRVIGPNAKTPERGHKIKAILGHDAPDEYIKMANADAKPSYLRAEYGAKDIWINPEGGIRGGTLPALIERLTMHDNRDTVFNNTFLVTFKSFTTLDEVFESLVKRFYIQPPLNLKPDELKEWTEQKLQVVRFRVINILRQMVTDEDVLEKEDMHILERIKGFAATVEKEVIPPIPAAKQLLVLVDRAQNGGDGMIKMRQVTPSFPPAPILPKTNKPMKLLDIEPLELARQLTIMESKLFTKIRPMECLNRGRDGRPGDSDDNISSIIDTSNKVAEWVADAVLSKDDSKKRAAIVKQFIAVADRCRLLQNFSTMAALVAGLNSPPIRRLKRTWEQVNARSKAQLQEAERTMDTNKNFTNYRAILKGAQLPCVPFFGVYLSVLTFIQDGNKNMIQGDIINFGKREKFAEVIREIKHYQSKPYNLTPIPTIQHFIDDMLSSLGNTADLSDRAWNLSLEREPREREDEKMARLLQESGFL